jgi:hypothetical protein
LGQIAGNRLIEDGFVQVKPESGPVAQRLHPARNRSNGGHGGGLTQDLSIVVNRVVGIRRLKSNVFNRGRQIPDRVDGLRYPRAVVRRFLTLQGFSDFPILVNDFFNCGKIIRFTANGGYSAGRAASLRLSRLLWLWKSRRKQAGGKH